MFSVCSFLHVACVFFLEHAAQTGLVAECLQACLLHCRGLASNEDGPGRGTVMVAVQFVIVLPFFLHVDSRSASHVPPKGHPLGQTRNCLHVCQV